MLAVLTTLCALGAAAWFLVAIDSIIFILTRAKTPRVILRQLKYLLIQIFFLVSCLYATTHLFIKTLEHAN